MASRYEWRGGNEIGAIYKLTQGEFESRRVGDAEAGDLLVCLGHTGDCHYRYALVRRPTAHSSGVFLYYSRAISGYACSRRVAGHFRASQSDLILWLAQSICLVVPHTPTQIRANITYPCWAK